MSLEQELRRVLKKHQPRHDPSGNLTCICPGILPAGLDRMEKHQAKKIVQMLQQKGFTP